MRNTLFLLMVGLFCASCQEKLGQLTLPAELLNGTTGLIEIDWPEQVENDQFNLFHTATSTTIPVQKTQANRGRLLFPPALSGHSQDLVLDIQPRDETETNNFQATDDGSLLELKTTTKDTPLLTYRHAEECPEEGLPRYYCRSGFIHPLSSPSGIPLTDDFPVGHTHQHALFFAWDPHLLPWRHHRLLEPTLRAGDGETQRVSGFIPGAGV